jgi:hypothetical protein
MVAVTVAAVAAVAAVATVATATAVFFFSNHQHVRVGMCERGIHFGLKKTSGAS